MSCDVTKFTISKGSDNTFIFTIKQDNSTLPLTIENTDTFSAKLILLSDNSVVHTYPITTPTTGSSDALNGKITLIIPSADTYGVGSGTDSLVRDVGSKVDRYYARPTYKLIIECSTVNNGDFIAKVDEVYVD